MKPSATKNRISGQKPYAVVELGDTLFFGEDIQQFYVVDSFRQERPYSGDVDLFQLTKDSKILPIVFEK